ncbi:MAG: Cobalamin synthase [Thermoanaerobacterales bacterium 50_218]|nr:MAG: Cobalamin synthase [Thermoanaerobacterales bacterium 50_218]HAA89895.1 adenosylcobinamide-GDP ribazoletransferase [Peptococcaceae bacterium]
MKAFLCALTFLTRIPLPQGRSFTARDFQNSSYFFPVVGLLIGLFLTGIWLVARVVFPSQITGALLVVFYLVITGGLHLDGLIDTFDGICSGQAREKVLMIMKDSRVGAFGVIAVFTVLILKFSFYSLIDFTHLPFLLLAPTAGRQAMVWALVLFPCARKQGLGYSFNVYHDFRKLILTTALTLFVFVYFLRVTGVIVFFAVGLFSLILMKYLSCLLGGLTGDTYGALCELAEVFVFLLGFGVGGEIW